MKSRWSSIAGEVGAREVDLAQGEWVLVWHADGMPEEDCQIVKEAGGKPT
jgi:hypothetical protein